MTSDLVRRIAEAFEWHRALGNQVAQGPHGRFVMDPAHPEVWSANHVSGITAAAPSEIEALLAEMDVRYAYSPWRVTCADPFTPPPFVARLLQEDFRPSGVTIQMVLEGELEPVQGPPARYRPVEGEGDWAELYRLLRIDHGEGARGRMALPESVSQGILADFRRKDGPSRYFLVEIEGQACAYGAAVNTPGGLGLIEDLFTLKPLRRRGIASCLIGHCVRHVRERGAGPVFLGAHAPERPKRLYAHLGFAPLLVTSQLVRRARPAAARA
jgi:GNAT superfamily N-acetyltransferase